MPRDESIDNTAVPREHLLSPRFAPQVVDDRRARVFEPPVTALNHWVKQVRADSRLPEGAGRTIPWFDPRGGGGDARILFLMQDPSEVATFTGFISPDNNDPTARNTTSACDKAGLNRLDRVHWNIFPWWVNVRKKGTPVDPSRPAQSHREAMPLAVEFLDDLLDCVLTRIEVVVLLGRKAQTGWEKCLPDHPTLGRRSSIHTLKCPHCSPLVYPRLDSMTGRPNREITIETLAKAGAVISGAR